MMKFSSFKQVETFADVVDLVEAKNTHMTHIEDSLIIDGFKGAKNIVNFLKGVAFMLSGDAKKSSVNLTVKWDGSPAIIAGIDPVTKKFFVGTKGVFAKTPKLNFTNADIKRNHGTVGPADKLKIALKYMKPLGIKGILQGDMMYQKSDLKDKNIDGVDFVTFRPNTILYAFDKASEEGKRILASKMGIVFHTSYTGSSMADMSASFSVSVGNLKKTKDVWFDNADFKDSSGSVTFTAKEQSAVEKEIKNVEAQLKNVDGKFLDSIAKTSDKSNLGVFELIQWYINRTVREGKLITKFDDFVREFSTVYKSKVQVKIDSVKKDDAKARWKAVQDRGLDFIKKNRKKLVATMKLHSAVTTAKNLLVNKLDQSQSVKTFIPDGISLKKTGAEGFVAIDKKSGNAFKFVDRLEFSRANFNVAKDWEKGTPVTIPEPKL